MKLKQKIKINAETINSISLDTKSIIVELKNGNKIKCKSIGSMNLTSWIDYSKEIEYLNRQQ